MTGLYEWNPLPHKVAVTCPNCGKEGIFEFAEMVEIALKDIDYFKTNTFFEYRLFEDKHGRTHPVAVFFHGFDGKDDTLSSINDLPDGYSISDWQHAKQWVRYHGLDMGTIYCLGCGLRKKTSLDWPTDAYYQLHIGNERLWAFNRASWSELKDFINSTTRQVDRYVYSNFLLHIPTTFLRRKQRKTMTAKMDRLLR